MDPIVEELAERSKAIGLTSCEAALPVFNELEDADALNYAALFWAVPATILGEFAEAVGAMESDGREVFFDEVVGEFAVWGTLEAAWGLGGELGDDTRFMETARTKVSVLSGLFHDVRESRFSLFKALDAVCSRDKMLQTELRTSNRLFKVSLSCVGGILDLVRSIATTMGSAPLK